ncbi:hypothetical protein L596_014315 [Steinernema carpocapsae]|uniref:Uncharacterized protein n=1 Tax=Steinernema carpocapsae TaxID=34508 RepID=A0A4V6A2Q4_STECR|nr:hypothetical protein L596_014315 [Steinernema carpocapsae]
MNDEPMNVYAAYCGLGSLLETLFQKWPTQEMDRLIDVFLTSDNLHLTARVPGNGIDFPACLITFEATRKGRSVYVVS